MKHLNAALLCIVAICQHASSLNGIRTNKVLSQLKRLRELIEKKSYVSNVRRNVKCLPLQFNALMMQYKSQSGYDNIYVGSTPRDAILFPNLLWDVNKRRLYIDLLNNLPIDQLKNINDPNTLLRVKNLVASKINVTVSQVTGILMARNQSQGKRDLLDSRISIAVANCTNPGDIDPDTTNVNLCEQCAVTTTLSDDRFPRYVNEVMCGQGKTCFQGDGTCKQNERHVHFLKKSKHCQKIIQNGNEVWLEKWDLVREPIRVSCECQLKRRSKMIGFV